MGQQAANPGVHRLSMTHSERQRNLMMHVQCPLPVYYSQIPLTLFVTKKTFNVTNLELDPINVWSHNSICFQNYIDISERSNGLNFKLFVISFQHSIFEHLWVELTCDTWCIEELCNQNNLFVYSLWYIGEMNTNNLTGSCIRITSLSE